MAKRSVRRDSTLLVSWRFCWTTGLASDKPLRAKTARWEKRILVLVVMKTMKIVREVKYTQERN